MINQNHKRIKENQEQEQEQEQEQNLPCPSFWKARYAVSVNLESHLEKLKENKSWPVVINQYLEMGLVIKPPTVSMPIVSGVPSRRTISQVSC